MRSVNLIEKSVSFRLGNINACEDKFLSYQFVISFCVFLFIFENYLDSLMNNSFYLISY